MSIDDKSEAYNKLVTKRKGCIICKELTTPKVNFKNQSSWPQFDKDEIGNWTTWANNLNADVVIVGQDYCNQEMFRKDKGKIEKNNLKPEADKKDYTTVTNYFLRELTKKLDLDVGVPSGTSQKKVFLTNVVLCLKSGPMNASIPTKVVKNCAPLFLKETIKIIKPKAIIALGHMATLGAIRALEEEIDIDKSLLTGSFTNLFRNGSLKIKSMPKTKIFPVFHPGGQGQSNRSKIEEGNTKGEDLQLQDWKKIKEHLDSN